MAATLADHMEIRAVKTVSGNSPRTTAIGEKSAQTFLSGVPVQVAASGFVQEWDGATVANGVAGFARIAGSNYATNAKGAPGVFGSVGAPATISTFGTVQNQASAVNIAHGAPFADGRTLFEMAVSDTIFEAQIDDSTGAAILSTQAMIGTKRGMTKDATGHWYVDLSKNNLVIIIGFNPADAIGTSGARAWFTILDSAQQLVS